MLEPLTPREKQVWELIATEAMTDRQIAERLGISIPSVCTFIRGLREKLPAENKIRIAVLWWQREHRREIAQIKEAA